jgi:Mn-dependent DtxR family transcriptional regulator
LKFFLNKKYGLGKEDVHKQAHNLEHRISDKELEEFDRILAYTAYSPNSKLIPRKKLLCKNNIKQTNKIY